MSHVYRQLLRWSSLLLFFTLTLQGATAAAEDLTAAGREFFEKQVRPILVQRCYECHAGDENNGGLKLDSRATVMRGGDSGAVLVSGNPDKSRLIEAVRYQNRDLLMPPQNRLPKSEVAVLEQWVRLGAPDTRVAKPTESPKPVGMTIADGRKFWSFQPVIQPRVPETKLSDRVQTPIDAFILAALEEQGLEPAPPADKRTLIRRATFDLTGLPPTPEEINAFLADQSVDAFPKVIERLLASPQYGVRWGRHWLDVARYADSNGLDENLAFGNAWRYRDYVVESFNRDKPFNQFLVEQLAGDLLPQANRETKTATGFLALGAKVLAEPDREKLTMDTIDEQLDTTGKAFLGMTFGCVRCHDHKFDPLKQTDYYALAAIFKSTKTFGDTNTGAIKHWYEHSFTTDEETKRLQQIEAEIAAKKSAAATYKNAAMSRIRTAARNKAVEYLVAAAKVSPGMPLTEVATIAAPRELHPRILHHCRLHLEYRRDDPFFQSWHEFVERDDLAGIDKHYRSLFQQADTAWTEAKKRDSAVKSLTDPSLEQARIAINDGAGFLAVPPKPEFAFDASTLKEYHRLLDEARVVESRAPDASAAMGVADGVVKKTLPVHIRGSHRNLGTPVAREFPEVMRTSPVRPIFTSTHSGRLEFARWLAGTQHPLTARVYVNRIWRWYFGAGLVTTTENFGRLGARPSHPALLDWLAHRFMQNGWSTKDIHRLIMTSSVYQMASTSPKSRGNQVDPENRLLWKFRQQRLEAEQIRDAILAVSGRLDLTLGGKTVPLRNRQFVFNHTSVDHTKYESLRRAIYLPVIRNNLYTLFTQFDFPDPTMPTGNRTSTVVAPQALLLMNSDLVLDSADAFADRLMNATTDNTARLNLAYERALGRVPTEAEVSRGLAFLQQVTKDNATPQTSRTAWSLLCQSLLACNEFIYVR